MAAPDPRAIQAPQAAPVGSDPHDAPLRVMALHALLYCPRLFYLEEVEEIRVADRAVYAGRELHASIEAQEDEQWSSVECESATLGLKGKVDCLCRRDGHLIPYEHKRGRPRREDDGSASAWPSDRVQIGAYALLIEEATGQPIVEGRIRYHAESITVRVPIDASLRREVADAVAEARRLRSSLARPAITDNERLCAKCSLAPICLPEEVRQLKNASHEPARLFPPDDSRGTLHVLRQGASVGRSAATLILKSLDEAGKFIESRHPSREIGSILLHGHAQISTQALRLCMDQEIAVHWVTAGGRYLGGLTAGAGRVQRRVRQYQALTDPVMRLRLSRTLVRARIEGQLGYLLRATRGKPSARQGVQPALNAIRQTLEQIPLVDSPDTLRGYEGEATAHYLRSINILLSETVPDELHYGGRTRRPPRDRFNALLGYGYSLLQAAVMRAVLAVGLEPAFGFYHTPRSAAHPLVLDLIELFRLALWDLVVIGSINRGQWDLQADFHVTRGGVWLSDQGRRKAIGLFENRLQESWKHPVLNYSLTYGRTIELESRLLEKEWSGEPGLFARARLR